MEDITLLNLAELNALLIDQTKRYNQLVKSGGSADQIIIGREIIKQIEQEIEIKELT